MNIGGSGLTRLATAVYLFLVDKLVFTKLHQLDHFGGADTGEMINFL